MKYFLKYLPVEGEIKGGDYILFKSQISRWLGGDLLFTREMNNEEVLKQSKKVKLFVCTRDNIQVGDKIFHEPTQTYNTFVKGDMHCFKVIGEVSSDALEFAKEGMELDDIEIYNKVYKKIPEENEPWGEPDNIKTVKIKCPCCKKFI